MCLFSITIVGLLGGWFFGKDPSQLAFLVGTLAATTAVGEASNIGKRATFKKEAVASESAGE
jgi:hypothetical protein